MASPSESQVPHISHLSATRRAQQEENLRGFENLPQDSTLSSDEERPLRPVLHPASFTRPGCGYKNYPGYKKLEALRARRDASPEVSDEDSNSDANPSSLAQSLPTSSVSSIPAIPESSTSPTSEDAVDGSDGEDSDASEHFKGFKRVVPARPSFTYFHFDYDNSYDSDSESESSQDGVDTEDEGAYDGDIEN
ncbi:hypothetical protein ABKN59_009288 [Abortiporus biennis]